MFRVALVSACVCAANAFTPSMVPHGGALTRSAVRAPLALRNVGSSRKGAATAVQMAFSFGKKEEPQRKMPWGNENPYRIFGVTEDAPYEEVEKAFQDLVKENEGNEKYIMQLEMMKEKIFDDRLKARMSGALKSKIADSPFDRKFVVRKEPWWSKISWLKDLVEVPTKQHTIQVSALMACFILAGLFAPQLSSTTMGFGYLASMGFLYNRGTPDIVRDDMGNPGESRPANYPALGKAIGLCSIMAGLGFMLSQVIIAGAALPASIQPDAIVNTFFNAGLWIAALFFRVQEK